MEAWRVHELLAVPSARNSNARRGAGVQTGLTIEKRPYFYDGVSQNLYYCTDRQQRSDAIRLRYLVYAICDTIVVEGKKLPPTLASALRLNTTLPEHQKIGVVSPAGPARFSVKAKQASVHQQQAYSLGTVGHLSL